MKHGAASIAVTLILAMCLQNVSAQAPLDSLKSDFEEEVGESITEFEEYSRQALEEYNEYSRQAAEDYAAYVQSIKTAWGGVFIDDTPTEWVEYGEDLLSRSIVDFDSGNITIEVIIPDDGTSEESLLADAVERLLNSRGSTCPYPSTVDVSEPLTASPILDGIVDFSGYDIDTSGIYSDDMRKPTPKAPPAPTVKGKTLPQEKSQRPERPASVSDKKTGADRQTMASRILEEERKAAEEKAAIAKAVAEQSVKTYETYGEGSETKKVVRINLSLVTDNLSKNAALYKDIMFVNDSAATIAEAVTFSMKNIAPLSTHLICGGTDKDLKATGMEEALTMATSITLLDGSFTRTRLLPLIESLGLEYEGPFSTMKEAFDVAVRKAEAKREEFNQVQCVLLSPGAASFELFRNEFDRGNQFKALVKTYVAKKSGQRRFPLSD